MPPALVVAHLMYITGWDWPTLMATPKSVRSAYTLILSVQGRRDREKQAEREAIAEAKRG